MANYTYLVEDLIAATENDGTEFLNYIPKIVGRAEERLTRVLDDYGLVQTTAVTFNVNDNSFTLPVGTRTIKNINYTLVHFRLFRSLVTTWQMKMQML